MKVLTSAPTVGEMINELYLKPSGVSPEEAAKLCMIECELFEAILNNRATIGYELAFKLAKGFNTSHDFWLNIQKDSDASSE